MTALYCDHGLYANNASFTGSISGSVLTVTAITGVLSLGSVIRVAGDSSPFPASVVSFGTGTGGVGTYNLSNSSSGTVTSRTMTADSGQPSSVPTWGQCQDGDGTAIGAATPSTASIVFTGIPSSGAIFVMGVAVTATWATSADNCANLLAAAINALTTVAVGPASFTNKSQVRNHLYARGPANGAAAGTCEVMTRQGSAGHAGLVCFTHTLNNVSSAATVNFSGGTGGAWGWLTNTYPIWASSITYGAYGLFSATPWFCGSVAGGDVVNIRSNKEIRLPQSTTFSSTFPTLGTAYSYVTYLIDDSTIWSDGSTPVINIYHRGTNNTSGYTSTFNQSATSFIYLKGKRYNDNLHSLTCLIGFYQNNGYVILWPFGGPMKIAGLEVKQDPLGSGGQQVLNASNTLNYTLHIRGEFTDCAFRQHASYSSSVISGGNPTYGSYTTFNNVIFDAGNPASPVPSVISLWGNFNATMYVELNGCRFINYPIGSVLAGVQSAYGTNRAVLARNCDWGNITVLGPSFHTLAKSMIPVRNMVSGVSSTSQLGNNDFFLDTPKGFVGWISTRSFPTLNAKLHDGITPWSIQVRPSTNNSNIGSTWPLETPRMVKINSLADGVRTITVNFGIEQTLAWTKGDVSVLVEYEDIDGIIRSIDTFDASNGALDASSALWNGADASFTYSESGDLTFDRYSLSITTPTAIATGTEIGVIFRAHTAVANAAQMLFVDPEAVVT